MGHVKKLPVFLGLLLLLAILVIPGAALQAYASLQIIPGGSVTGTVAVSSDGCGTNSPPCNIFQNVIPGATVLKAFLYGTSTGNGPPSITVSLDGTPLTLNSLPQNEAPSGLESYRTDVTTQVANALTANSAHVFSVVDSIGQSTGVVDGLALVIIYSDASLPQSSVLVFDGGQQAAPTNQILFFGAPVDTAAPGFMAEMRLGIGFSAQDQGNPPGLNHCGGDSVMDSQVDVNGVRLTSCAGNFDDGVGTFGNGVLFTIGGDNDDLLNPADPFQRSGQGATSELIDDDERYDISGFITDGDTQMSLDTENTSFDDILFLSILYFKTLTVTEEPPPPFECPPGFIEIAPGVCVCPPGFIEVGGMCIPDQQPPQVGGELVPIDTSALLLAGVQSISMWMIPVVIAGVGIGVFVIKRRN